MSQKNKILYLITGTSVGGAEVVLSDLINGLKNKFEVIVVSIAPVGEVGEKMRRDGLRVFSLDAKFKYNPLIIWRFFRIIKKEKPNIIHTHLFHADILGRVVGKLIGSLKIITTIHNINIGGKIREFLMRITMNFSDYNVAVSGIVLKNAKELKMVNENSSVIYNGINLEKFSSKNKKSIRKKLNIPENKDVFISVGSLTGQKGYNYLIESVLGTKKSIFYILGEGQEREKLEDKIKENQLEEKIILKSNVKNVGEYLCSSDFFIMPSLWEGFSIALLEAAATKKTIIATDVGGNSEVIVDKETGFLIEPKNPKALAEKIEYVLGLSEEEREEIGEKARKLVEERFSVEKMVNEYEKLYKNLMELSHFKK